jgi:hypothetical protein
MQRDSVPSDSSSVWNCYFQNAKLLTHESGFREQDTEKSRLGYAVGSSELIRETMPTCPDKPARGALLSFSKRNLSPLRRACLSLGLPVDARPRTNLALLLRKAKLGKTAWGASDIPDSIGPRSIGRFGKEWTSETLVNAHFVYRSGGSEPHDAHSGRRPKHRSSPVFR